jgi:hypothetical protein
MKVLESACLVFESGMRDAPFLAFDRASLSKNY